MLRDFVFMLCIDQKFMWYVLVCSLTCIALLMSCLMLQISIRHDKKHKRTKRGVATHTRSVVTIGEDGAICISHRK